MQKKGSWVCLLLALVLCAGLAVAEDGPRLPTGTVVRADTAETYAGLAAQRPSIAVLRVDAALNILDADGAILATVPEAVSALGDNMALAFEAADATTVQALVEATPREAGPMLIISADADALCVAMEARAPYLLVLDRSALQAPAAVQADAVLSALRAETVGCGAINVLLGADWAQPAWIPWLQRGLVSVWLAAEDDSPTHLMNLITAGANAILHEDSAAVEGCLSMLGENAVTRRVFLSGHRGGMHLAPENTFYAFDAGIAAGCDILELDVWMTRDGEVVVMHDNEVFRTTGAPGTVERLTWEAIQALPANYEWAGDARFADAKVPRLDDVLARYKDTDISLMIEIKGSDVKLYAAIAALVESHGMQDQCTVISNNYVSIAVMKKDAPAMGRGLLANKMFDSEADPEGSVEKALGYATKYSCHIFPDGEGQRGEAYLQAMAKLGLGTIAFAWTENAVDTGMTRGLYAVCTNDPDWVSSYAHTVALATPAQPLAVGATLPVMGKVITYGEGSFPTESLRLLPVEGTENIAIEGNTITAVAAGSASVIAEYTQVTTQGSRYRLYTQPLVLTIE